MENLINDDLSSSNNENNSDSDNEVDNGESNEKFLKS